MKRLIQFVMWWAGACFALIPHVKFLLSSDSIHPISVIGISVFGIAIMVASYGPPKA
jgi:hypothetical protein